MVSKATARSGNRAKGKTKIGLPEPLVGPPGRGTRGDGGSSQALEDPQRAKDWEEWPRGPSIEKPNAVEFGGINR